MRGHPHFRNLGQQVQYLFRDAVGEILLIPFRTQISEGQDDNRPFCLKCACRFSGYYNFVEHEKKDDYRYEPDEAKSHYGPFQKSGATACGSRDHRLLTFNYRLFG